MADTVQIYDALGVLQTIATDDVGGKHYQRTKTGLGPDGTANDQLDAANAADSNNGQGVAAAGSYLYEEQGGSWKRARAARPDGGGLAQTPAAAAIHLYDGSSSYYPQWLASSLGDGASGARHPGATPLLWNGASYDRQRNNVQGTLLASAARTASTASASQTNHNARGVVLFLNVTVAGTSTLTLQLAYVDPVVGGTNWFVQPNASMFSVTGVGQWAVDVCPGAAAAGAPGSGVVKHIQAALPRTWNGYVAHGDASSWTYSLGYSYVS